MFLSKGTQTGDLLDVNSIHLNDSTSRSPAYCNRAINDNHKNCETNYLETRLPSFMNK